MRGSELAFVVPGPLDQLTGGYVYDAHIVAGLRELGWRVDVHNLAGRFPDPDAQALESMGRVLGSLPGGARVVIDGLAMGGLPTPLGLHAQRLRMLSLVHHPLAAETGISMADEARLTDSERRALSACAGVLVTSEFTARGLARYGVRAERVRVVAPGTEPARPAEGPGPGRAPVLLCVASVTRRKGHDVLIAALERIRDLPWTSVCAGGLDRDPGHAASVLRRAADARLLGRIDFVGERAPAMLDRLYHGASLFVLASHYEGYGMALADALAHGLPVVSTTGGAIPFTVPADAALLVEPGDPAALAGALRTLLAPPGTARKRLAAGARRHASRLPTWPQAARAFAAAVEELTS